MKLTRPEALRLLGMLAEFYTNDAELGSTATPLTRSVKAAVTVSNDPGSISSLLSLGSLEFSVIFSKCQLTLLGSFL